MFEEELLKARVAKFFDNLELQFANILQLSKLRERKSFEDERALAGYLVNFCEGQFYAWFVLISAITNTNILKNSGHLLSLYLINYDYTLARTRRINLT